MERDDESGAMPVLEAILVALLVLTAILFVTGVQRPLKGSEEGGVDLGRLAGQTLSLLSQATFVVAGQPQPLEGWVQAAMSGDADTVALVDTYLEEVLPPGTMHTLLLSNGYGTLRLAPVADPGPPRNARWAEIPFLPNWRAFSGEVVDPAWAYPGQEVGAGHPVLGSFTNPMSLVACIKAPDGSAEGPGGADWVTAWRDGTGHVPIGAPYGVWAGYAADCATDPVYGRVGLRDGTLTDHPLYGIRLVVWFGA